jgi:ATP adenylyltransferase
MAELDILWAGWRSQYVQGLGQGDEECIFCRLPGQDDEEGLILRRGEHAFAVLNRYPYATGHLMVGPYRHVAGPGDLDDAERSEMWSLLALGEEAARRAISPDGFNIGANLGRVAGAGVPGHLHFHLVPRWSGDTNFMSVVGGTRVIPEDLADTWNRLRAEL